MDTVSFDIFQSPEGIEEYVEMAVENPEMIDEVLVEYFNDQIAVIAGEKILDGQVGSYTQINFDLARCFLYGSGEPDLIIEEINESASSMGLCGKVFEHGDIAWRCKDCEKDPTCIMCQECFEKSDHTGHRTQLLQSVSGCCDCGDPDGYKEEGFCSDHKGFAASSEAMIASLPEYLKDSSPRVFGAVCNAFKKVLLTRAALANKFFEFFEEMLEEVPSNIYYLSRALCETYLGKGHHKQAGHTCCHRYFVNENDREKFTQQSLLSSPSDNCTCTILDLLCQSSFSYEIEDIIMTMFQNYEFKQHLCHAYIANIRSLFTRVELGGGIMQLGVQVLTCDDMVVMVFGDAMLRQCITESIDFFIDLLKSKPNSEENSFETRKDFMRFSSLRQDVKYMSKPQTIPFIIHQTDFLEKLLHCLSKFYFSDIFFQVPSMQQYEINTVNNNMVSEEVELIIMTQRFLNCANGTLEVQGRILECFRQILEQKDPILQNTLMRVPNERPRGFYFITLHRLLASFLSRLVVQECILEDEFYQPGERNIYNLALQRYMPDATQRDQFISRAIITLARQQGFCSEITAKKWIYKGERLQYIPVMEHNQLYEVYFVRAIALLQMLICCSERPQKAVEELCENFGTDDWLEIFFTQVKQAFLPKKLKLSEKMDELEKRLSLTAWLGGEQPSEEDKTVFEELSEQNIRDLCKKWPRTYAWFTLCSIFTQQAREIWMSRPPKIQEPQKAFWPIKKDAFKNCLNFDGEKLGFHIQQLLLKLIQLGIHETPVLAQCQKDLFNDQKKEQKFKQIYGKCLERHLFHSLFLQGAASSIKDIKKVTENMYVKSEYFDQIVINLTNQQINSTGTKQFRVKNDPPIIKMYDPFYFTNSDQIMKNQEIYSDLWKDKSGLNNFIGDYENSQFQTTIISGVRRAIGTSPTTVEFIAGVLRFCADVAIFNAGKVEMRPVSAFEKEVFPIKTLFMAVKLGIWIADQKCEETLDLLRTRVPRKVIQLVCSSIDDKKFYAIGEHLSNLLHGVETRKEASKESQKADKPSDRQSEAEAKKAALAKRKALMLKKMKSKQATTIASVVKAAVGEQQEQKQETNQVGITCATCQEPIEMKDRPFVQLGTSMPSKLLYLTSMQTLRSQQRHLSNEKNLAQGGQEEKSAVQEQKSAFQVLAEEQEESKLEMINTGNDQEDYSQHEREAHIWNRDALDLKTVMHGEGQAPTNGISFQKCCHFLHADCLQTYLEKQSQLDGEQQYVNSLIGIDKSAIKCPLCKCYSNTWQPYFPLQSDSKLDVQTVFPYIQFLSQIRHAHLSGKEWEKRESGVAGMQKDPLQFCRDMMSLVTHSMLVLGSVKSQNLWASHNPNQNQEDFTLRDIAYIMRTVRTLIEQTGQRYQIGEQLLKEVSTALNYPFTTNYGRLVTQTLFCLSLMLPFGELEHATEQKSLIIARATDMICQAAFKQVRAQVIMSQTFRAKFGQLTPQQIVEGFEEQLKNGEESEEMLQGQLKFLRISAAAVMCFKSLDVSANNENQMRQFGCQLGLDTDTMNALKLEYDDLSEVKYLTKYLDLDASREGATLDDCLPEASKLIQLCFGDGISKDLAIKKFIKLQLADQQISETEENPKLRIHESLLMLTPFFSFEFIDLPLDFMDFQQKHYARKCRNCNQQVQINAICLLCGDVICFNRKDNCCKNLPGMIKDVPYPQRFGGFAQKKACEGEMSYHARHCEGGTSVFILPTSGEVYLVNEGRMSLYDSFYRNNLGEVYNRSNKDNKWHSFQISKESGGTQALDQLKKAFLKGKIPNMIVQARLADDRVIRRYMY